MVASTSPFSVSRPYWAAIPSCPSARSVGINFWKHVPSAQIPWAKTMLGLVMAFSFSESLRRLAAVEAPGPNEGCIALPVASQDDNPAEDIAGRSYTLGHPLANELTLWRDRKRT